MIRRSAVTLLLAWSMTLGVSFAAEATAGLPTVQRTASTGLTLAEPPACTMTADPVGNPILKQSLLTAVASSGSADPTLCIENGSYTIKAALTIPIPMNVIGVGGSAPVIECAPFIFCFNGSAGPSGVRLENLAFDGASKADVQIGASGGPLVEDWTLTGITATGAGQVGVAINTAANITISGSTIAENGPTPANTDPTQHTSDFGLRAASVDHLTVEGSKILDNVTTIAPDLGYSGGAKFNTVTNLVVQDNEFAGNGGNAQLWIDIDSHDFEVSGNTIVERANIITGMFANERIRVEVSCAGSTGGLIHDNHLTVPDGMVVPNDVAGIDLYDSSDIRVQHNDITVPQGAAYGIRMFGNQHDPQPFHACEQAGTYPNEGNTAVGNTIDMRSTGSALNGVKNTAFGVSSGNSWSDNTYLMRHCDIEGPNAQWIWWDGNTSQLADYLGWQGSGQDIGGMAQCTAFYPEIDASTPFDPPWGPAGTAVTIKGSGLHDVTSVKFNTVPASVISTSDTAVVATLPTGATTGPVCVKSSLAGWCSTQDFTVAPVASVSGFGPTSGLPGTDVVLIGQGFTGATRVTFAGSVAVFQPVSDAEIDAKVPMGAKSGAVCIQLPIQGNVCGAEPFTVSPPAPPDILSSLTTFQLAPFSATWTASEGATSYEMIRRSAPFDGGFPSTWEQSGPISGTSFALPFHPGDTTCFGITALDGGGPSPTAQSCTAVPLDDRSLKKGKGTWSKSSGSRYYLGTSTSSTVKGSSLLLSNIQTRALSLVVEMRPGGGTVDVLWNGRLLGRASTDASAVRDQRLIPIVSWTGLHTGTLTLQVHSSGKPVVIDGLATSHV